MTRPTIGDWNGFNTMNASDLQDSYVMARSLFSSDFNAGGTRRLSGCLVLSEQESAPRISCGDAGR